MPAGTEMDILKYLEQQGGQCKMGSIKRLFACYGPYYLELVCGSLGRRDYIDWLKDGTVKLAKKGWRALGKAPPEEQLLSQNPEKPRESPEERYWRWLGKTLHEEPPIK